MLNESKLQICSKNGIWDIERKAANVPCYSKVAEVDLRMHQQCLEHFNQRYESCSVKSGSAVPNRVNGCEDVGLNFELHGSSYAFILILKFGFLQRGKWAQFFIFVDFN